MKLNIKKEILNEKLNIVSKAISTKNIIPVLCGIKFDLTSEGLFLTTSNDDIAIETFIDKQEIDTIEDIGTIIIPGKYFLEIIRKIDDEFELEFIPKSILSGFINGSSNIGRVTIKFCNSGSYYAPFNVMFMRLFNKLQLVDDVKDIKHQVSIDEYMYNKNKGKRLVKR